jgi:hypothetical protein
MGLVGIEFDPSIGPTPNFTTTKFMSGPSRDRILSFDRAYAKRISFIWEAYVWAQ